MSTARTNTNVPNRNSGITPGLGSEGLTVKGSKIVPLLLIAIFTVIFLAKGIQWADFGLFASPRFSTDGSDFKHVEKFVERLKSPAANDHVSQFVWREFAADTREALSSNLTPLQLQKKLLATELNKIIEREYTIYSSQLFPSDLGKFDLRVGDIENADLLPGSDNKTPVVIIAVAANEEEKSELYIRVFYDKYNRIDYVQGELPDQFGEVDALREKLKPLFGTEDVTPANKTELVGEIMSLLGLSGLDYNIDSAMKQSLQIGGDHALANRLLLENAYPEEINKNSKKYEKGLFNILGDAVAGIFQATLQAVVADIPLFIRLQIRTIWILALCSLIPGLAGLVYRRAFWRWFLFSFALMFLINWLFVSFERGGIGWELRNELRFKYGFYLEVEVLLVLLLFRFRLRRCSAPATEFKTRVKNTILAAFMILLAIAIGFIYWNFFDVNAITTQFWLLLAVMAFLLLVANSIIWQTIASLNDRDMAPKNIVVCFDGTWNQPGQKDFGYLAETNVFKLFTILRGTPRKNYNASLCKEYMVDKSVKQIAFYFHGVGNKVENSELGQLFGGAFGMGADGVVERAYLDVVRVYRPGDRIFVFGFSRGAAIARLFAGVIGRRGFPKSLWSLRLFGRHWTLWKSSDKLNIPDDREKEMRLVEPESETLYGPLPPAKQPRVIEVLGCWDTVGSFGISKNILGIPFQKINLLKNLTVSDCVKRAYHMLALDETRDAFVPSLMDPDPITPSRIIEVWFSGSHCNVGGGFATDRLSDVALDFLLRHISSQYAYLDEKHPQDDWFPYLSSGARKPNPESESWGLYLHQVKQDIHNVKSFLIKDENNKEDPGYQLEIDADPRGRLRESSGAMYKFAARELPLHAVIFDSVFERMRDVLPVYAPASLFDLNDRFVIKRNAIQEELERLKETDSHDADECAKIQKWSNEKLKLTKWSQYLRQSVQVSYDKQKKVLLQDTVDPAIELKLPIPKPSK